MYGTNPCGSPAGVGAYGPTSTGPTLNGANGNSWWEQPVTQITGAIAQRIGGATSPYSPGTYRYGDPGYSSPMAYPVPYPTPDPTRTPALATGAGVILLGVVALGAAKFFGVF